MFKNKLFTSILIRIVLILISSFAFISILPFLQNEYYLSLIGIGLLMIYQVYLLAKYLNTTNQKLALFFDSIRNEDSVLMHSSKQNEKIFNDLDSSLNELNEKISKIRRKNASQSIFLNNLVEHVSVGLISYSNDGNIQIFNKAAKELLQINQINNIIDLKKYHNELSSCIYQLKPYNTQLVKVKTKQSALALSIKLSIFKSEEETINLLSLQNIRNEIEQTELNTWQKLISVLRHEISNSISPIVSLANTTKKYFLSTDTQSLVRIDDLTETTLHKTINSLDTIESTGKGLIGFVEKYRSLSDLPQAKIEKIVVTKLFEKLKILLLKEASSRDIKLEFKSTPSKLEILADFSLLEKVIINLIQNAFHALEGTVNGTIIVNAYHNIENRVVIEVCDNGHGIPPHLLDDIFIPFYTTKESLTNENVSGSGIGLSLSRQIMRLHNGSIIVNSKPNEETIFNLVF